MSNPRTVKVHLIDDEIHDADDEVTINESDFDEEKHELVKGQELSGGPRRPNLGRSGASKSGSSKAKKGKKAAASTTDYDEHADTSSAASTTKD